MLVLRPAGLSPAPALRRREGGEEGGVWGVCGGEFQCVGKGPRRAPLTWRTRNLRRGDGLLREHDPRARTATQVGSAEAGVPEAVGQDPWRAHPGRGRLRTYPLRHGLGAVGQDSAASAGHHLRCWFGCLALFSSCALCLARPGATCDGRETPRPAALLSLDATDACPEASLRVCCACRDSIAPTRGQSPTTSSSGRPPRTPARSWTRSPPSAAPPLVPFFHSRPGPHVPTTPPPPAQAAQQTARARWRE